MLFKLINNNPQPFKGRFIRHNGRIYANPTDKQLKEVGYKPLITTEYPDDVDGYVWTAKYTESEDSITQEWVKEEVNEEWTAQ